MTKRVVVIGAGVVGLSVGLYCIERGFDVTVVERNGKERDGCSFGNAGMIVPSHFIPLAAPGAVAQALKWMLNPRSPFYLKPRASWDLIDWGMKFWGASNAERVERAATALRDLHLASRACYAELADGGDDFGLSESGTLMLCKTPQALAEETRTAKYARALGLPADVLDRGETEALEPGVQMDVAGSVFFPTDCKIRRSSSARCSAGWPSAVRASRGTRRSRRIASKRERSAQRWRRSATSKATNSCSRQVHGRPRSRGSSTSASRFRRERATA